MPPTIARAATTSTVMRIVLAVVMCSAVTIFPAARPALAAPGSVTVYKVVDSNGSTPDPAQTFTLCIDGSGVASPLCGQVGANGGSVTFYDLPAGAYNAYEWDPGPGWQTPTGGGLVSVADDTNAEVTITNRRHSTPGTLTVRKVVDWNGVDSDPDQEFTLCASGGSLSTPACDSVGSAGGSVTFADLDPDTYTVYEELPGGGWRSPEGGGEVVVPSGGAAESTITNTHVGSADLSVTNVASLDELVPGARVSFQVTISNAGPSPAQDVLATATLPAGFTVESTTGCAEDPAGVPTCTLGSLASSGSASSAQYTINGIIDDDAREDLTMAVSVDSTTPDPDSDDNDAEATVQAASPTPSTSTTTSTTSTSTSTTSTTILASGVLETGSGAPVSPVASAGTSSLPRTGSSVVDLIRIALLALGMGASVVLATRTRHERTD